MSQTIELKVPDIGGHANVDIIEVAITAGQAVQKDETLITLETDKATMDVPCEFDGVIESVFVKVGDKISEGGVIATLILASTAAEPVKAAEQPAPQMPLPTAEVPVETKPTPVATPVPAPAVSVPSAILVDEAGFAAAHAGPSARKLARELGVDLGKVKGSGRKGRVMEDDIKAFVKAAMTAPQAAGASAAGLGGLNLLPWPEVDFAKFGPIHAEPLTKIQKISGANLSRNWAMIPHVTFNDECDVTELEVFRKTLSKEWEKSGQKLSPLAFIIKAAAKALQVFPRFNSSLRGDELVLKQYYHIGFAADTPNGLVVPVIKNADQLGLKEIAQELVRLSGLAREGKLKPTDMQGATFTISSLGGIGGTSFTPIINAPEVAILGVCKNQTKPVWNGKDFEPRLICPLSLSFDHRVIDGAEAARFTVYLGQLLSDLRRLIV